MPRVALTVIRPFCGVSYLKKFAWGMTTALAMNIYNIMKIHIGTSGWNYDCFAGKLYPEGTPRRRYLEAYAQRFETVELNASFYRGFPEKVWQGWYRRTPVGFLWSVKASRFLTHIRRLAVSQEEINRFWQSVAPLKDKMAVALFQLPPNLPYDQGLLTSFLSLQPKDGRIALEARHPTWHTEDVWHILGDHGVAWVISHSAGHYPMSIITTADMAYVRLHGTRGLYTGSYGPDELSKWIGRIRKWKVETFVYFDNTADGSAADDALAMLRMIRHPGTD